MVSLFFFGRRGEGDDCGFVELTLCSLLQKREGDRRRSGSGEEGGRRERYYRRLAAGNGCTDGLGHRSMAFVVGERKGWECAAVLSEKIMGQTANGFFALGRSALHALELACGVSAQSTQEAPHCWARQRSIEYSYQEIERARLERF